MHSLTEHALILITNLGDSGLLTVLALLCAFYLYFAGSIRTALILTSVVLLCMAIMGALKIYFLGCHHLIPVLDIESPSGHAAMSAAIYGTLTAIVTKRLSGGLRWIAIGAAAGLVLMIALSRILLDHHTINEVLLGLCVGSALALGAILLLRPLTEITFRARYLGLTFFVAVALLYGSRTPAEVFIRKVAALLNDNLHFCA